MYGDRSPGRCTSAESPPNKSFQATQGLPPFYCLERVVEFSSSFKYLWPCAPELRFVRRSESATVSRSEAGYRLTRLPILCVSSSSALV